MTLLRVGSFLGIKGNKGVLNMDWINVKDCLPSPEYYNVIGWSEAFNNWQVVWFDWNRKSWFTPDGKSAKITHWLNIKSPWNVKANGEQDV